MKEDFLTQLHLEHSRRVTLVGAGGKTSLLYALAQEMSLRHRVLITTTTHILPPDDLPGAVHVTEEDPSQILSAFRRSRLVALGIPEQHSGKWSSPSMSFLQNIAAIPDRILCEGDGSRRLPVKIPGKGEPVFFPDTDTVIGVIGLSCLHQNAENCLFRREGVPRIPALYAALKANGGRLSPEALMEIALSPLGLRKNVADRRYLVVFNQADCLSPQDLVSIQNIAQEIRDNKTECFVVSLKKNHMLT